MENISKALLIAGGVLLGLLLISLLLNVFNIISDSEKSKEELLSVEQLAKFNSYYESFNKETIYGTDLLTLSNKIKEDEKKYEGVNISILGNIQIPDTTLVDHDTLKAQKEQKYKCIEINYDLEGRVKSLTFEKIIEE